MLGNFQAVSAITEGLCSEDIKALDLTWINMDKCRPLGRLRNFIGPKTNLEALCTAHDALSRSKPCVPFIRAYFPALFHLLLLSRLSLCDLRTYSPLSLLCYFFYII